MSERETPIIETERFVLRPLMREDAEALFPTLGDEEQCRYLTRAHFSSVEDLAAWLCDPDWNGRSWSAIDRTNKQLVARVVSVPVSEGVEEIGYITAIERRGEGISYECASALVGRLFGTEGLHRVIAGTDPRNHASNSLLEKLGFRREAHYIEGVKTHIGWCDEYYWGLLAREWRSRKGLSAEPDQVGSESET